MVAVALAVASAAIAVPVSVAAAAAFVVAAETVVPAGEEAVADSYHDVGAVALCLGGGSVLLEPLPSAPGSWALGWDALVPDHQAPPALG